jgi:hypothetical protein
MPQFQMIEKAPNFIEEISGQLGAGVGQGLQNKLAQFQEQRKIENTTPELSRLLSETTGTEISPEMVGAYLSQGGDVKDLLSFSSTLQARRAKEEEGVQKQQMAKEEGQKKYQTFSKIIAKMEDLKPYVGTTLVPGTKSFGGKIPYSKAAEKRAKIDTLRLTLEGLFRDLTLKGQFPKAIYERILDHLPSSKDSEKKFQGKIDAMKDILQSYFGGEEEIINEKEKISPTKATLSLEEIFR